MNALVAELKASAEGLRPARHQTAGSSCEITAFMRYAGQGWEIPVPLPDQRFRQRTLPVSLQTAFQENYERFFGRAIDGLDGLEIEIVTWSVKASDERAGVREAPVQLRRSAPSGQP